MIRFLIFNHLFCYFIFIYFFLFFLNMEWGNLDAFLSTQGELNQNRKGSEVCLVYTSKEIMMLIKNDLPKDYGLLIIFWIQFCWDESEGIYISSPLWLCCFQLKKPFHCFWFPYYFFTLLVPNLYSVWVTSIKIQTFHVYVTWVYQ